jgi:agmatine deiminase
VATFQLILQGWKADWWYDDYTPKDIAWELYLEAEFVRMVNEGGSIEVDGRGTLMAKRSSILNHNRNPGVSQNEAEEYFRRYLGVTNFIWLDGTPGLEITDDHIDGTARFANGDTIVTYHRDDFIDPSEYDVLVSATDAIGNRYKIVHLPITVYEVPIVRDYGIYINYYVGNEVVILPIFNDPNDDEAASVMKQLYPRKEIVRIDFTELYIDGGLVHCVTMQQPAAR